MISQNTINKVFDTARVEEVISDFVQLKKSGSNFKGLSPFTDERSPSFMVSPVKQIWKDFSSGKGGNVVSFLIEHEHFTFPEAVKYLAKKYNIEVEETQTSNEDKEKASERESMYLVSEYASNYFQEVLHNTDQGRSIGLSYFKERGFSLETIKTFQLGYSLNQWQAFTDEATKQGYKLSYLEKTGLTIVKDTKTFDRFKGRVMFPIQSLSGRVLGFGGRILTNSKKEAKYLNSPESDIYNKSKVLYGIFYAKSAIAKANNCFLVEGYTDVIQMHQRGVKNVVSSSGTALTPDQIRLVNRLTDNITVLFDGDSAGLRASLRSIDIILEQGMNVKICSFPEGDDPDSFAKANDLETITNYLASNSKDFIQFKASLLAETAANDPIKKAETIREIVTSIAKIPDRIKQEVYIQESAKIMDVSEAVLFNTLAQISKKDVQEAQKSYRKQQKALEIVPDDISRQKVDIQFELERKIIEILLLYGKHEETFEDLELKESETGSLEFIPIQYQAKVYEKVYLDLQEDEMEFTNPEFKALYALIIDSLQNKPDLPLERLVDTLEDQNLSTRITSIMMEDERYNLHDWTRNNIFPKEKRTTIAQLVSETILSLRCYLIDCKVREFQEKTKMSTTNVNYDILEQVKDYSSLKMLLSRKLNRVL